MDASIKNFSAYGNRGLLLGIMGWDYAIVFPLSFLSLSPFSPSIYRRGLQILGLKITSCEVPHIEVM
jgi:hypothetical protein